LFLGLVRLSDLMNWMKIGNEANVDDLKCHWLFSRLCVLLNF
jgi:hypothetical protein